MAQVQKSQSRIVMPKISFILCTVRGDFAFAQAPERKLFDHVKAELEKQTFKDFELIVVDGLREFREFPECSFPVKHVAPLDNIWTRNKKVAISTYRNTGIVHSDAELIVNLDDTFVLPERWAELYHSLWYEYNKCGAATWRHNGDTRLHMTESLKDAQYSQVFGFGSYPLEMALELNGYDLSFDGSMYLEDVEWGCRLFNAGLKQTLFWLDGFNLEAQTGHDPRAVDADSSIVKCCNPAWQMARVHRNTVKANVVELWDKGSINYLLAPCQLLTHDGKCLHHDGHNDCAYLTTNLWGDGDRGHVLHSFVNKRHPLTENLRAEDFALDLRALHNKRREGELEND